MGLKEILNAGQMILGSKLDKPGLKSMMDMSITAQRRQGYADQNGYWTDRGYDRATSKDYQALEKSRQALLKKSKG